MTSLPDVVVHSYAAGGFEVAEQLAKYDAVSINVTLYGVLNVGLSISEEKQWECFIRIRLLQATQKL